MSLRHKVIGTLLAGALLGSAALSAEKPKSSDPVVQTQSTQQKKPSKTQKQPKQSPPPKAGSHSSPRTDRQPQNRHDNSYRPNERKPQAHRPQLPGTPEYRAHERDRHHRPDYRPRHWPQGGHHRLHSHPYWGPHWNQWGVNVRIGHIWPHWSVWGWDNTNTYRAYEQDGTLNTFEILPPPGYDEAIVAYFQSPRGETVRVELARETKNGIELTVLRDDGANGTLEEAIEIEGPSREDARRHYLTVRDKRHYQLPERQADSLYEYLWDEIRERI